MFRMMTDFPLVYKKLLPFGSPPMILETPLSTCGRLANTVSKREKGHSFSLGGGKRKTVGIECNLLLRPSREAAGGSSQPSRSRDPPRSGDARAAGKVPRPAGGSRKDWSYIFPDRRWNRTTITTPPFLAHSDFRAPPKRGPPSHSIEGKRRAPRTDSNWARRKPFLLLRLLHWSWKAEPRPRSPPTYLAASPRTAATPPLTQLVGHRGCLSLLRRLQGRRVHAGPQREQRQGKTRQSLASLLSSSTSSSSSSGGGGERRQLQAAQSRKRSSPSSRFTPGFDHI